MNSVVKLFKTKITMQRNCIVDNIEDYLLTCESLTRSNFQYIKHALALTIKLNMNQSSLSTLTYNYVSIKNDDSNKVYYYFISAIKWLAVDTLALELNLDTLNTFQDIEFSNRTQIVREIKQRFLNNEQGGDSMRYIDDIVEGIKFPQKVIYRKKLNEGLDSFKWYMITSSNADLTTEGGDTNNPVQVALVPSEPLLKYEANSEFAPISVTLRANEMSGGAKYMYFLASDNPGGLTNASDTPLGTEVINDTLKMFKLTRMEVNGIPKIYFEELYYYTALGELDRNRGIAVTLDSITFTKMKFGILSNLNLYTGDDLRFLENSLRRPRININVGYNEAVYSNSIKDIDKTDSRLVKIVELPYCPLPLKQSIYGTYGIDGCHYKFGCWYVDTYYTDEYLSTLKGTIDLSNYMNVDLPSVNAIDESGYEAYNVNKNINFESKLYSSEFFNVKLVYDSFHYSIELERISEPRFEQIGCYGSTIKIDFKMNSNIKSILGFKWYNSIQGAEMYDSDEDYPQYLICDRNNEITIYNANYINYLKNGFNYDKKQKEKEIALGVAGIVTQIIGSIASFVSTPVTGATGIVGGVALATSSAVSIGAQVAQISQNEEARKNKRDELRSQAINVINADDTDMLEFYGGDKLQLIIHDVKESYKNILFNLFYYTGYASNRVGVPYYKNNPQRLLFDYVQCNAIFNNIEAYESEFIDDMTSRFNAGVTIFHKIPIRNTWNFEQDKANLDSWLIQ